MDDWLQQYLDYINTADTGDYEISEVNPYLSSIEDAWLGYDIHGYQGLILI